MIKKISLAALLIFVLAIFLAGCSSTGDTKSGGVAGQSPVGQETGPGVTASDSGGGTTSDSAVRTTSEPSVNITSEPAGGATNPANRYVRTDNGEGGVQVKAIWITQEYLKAAGQDNQAKKYDLSKNIVIQIDMTTHMGDLSKYQILNNAELAVDGKAMKPASWDVLSASAHHPQGLLVFPGRDSSKVDGSKLELTLRQLNGVPERKLSW